MSLVEWLLGVPLPSCTNQNNFTFPVPKSKLKGVL